MGSLALGFGAAFVGAFGWGSWPVLVKSYNAQLGDGFLFQLWMCTGVLLAGLLTLVVSPEESGYAPGEGGMLGELRPRIPLLCVLSGVLWASGNVVTVEMVRCLGLGLGMATQTGTSLLVAYFAGLLGPCVRHECLPPSELTYQWMGFAGCALSIAGLLLFAQVKPPTDNGSSKPDNDDDSEIETVSGGLDGDDDEVVDRPPAKSSRRGHGHSGQRSAYTHLDSGRRNHGAGGWEAELMGKGTSLDTRADANTPGISGQPLDAAVEDGSSGKAGGVNPTVRSSADALAPLGGMLQDDRVVEWGDNSRHPSMQEISTKNEFGKWLRGLSLALFAGGVYGVQFLPCAIYALHHRPDPQTGSFVRRLRVTLAQFLGSFVASVAIYAIYAFVMRARRFHAHEVPLAAMLPSIGAGALWSLGTLSGMVAMDGLGYGIGYALTSNGAFLIAILWSTCVFKEIQGRKNMFLFVAAALCNISATSLIAVQRSLSEASNTPPTTSASDISILGLATLPSPSMAPGYTRGAPIVVLRQRPPPPPPPLASSANSSRPQSAHDATSSVPQHGDSKPAPIKPIVRLPVQGHVLPAPASKHPNKLAAAPPTASSAMPSPSHSFSLPKPIVRSPPSAVPIPSRLPPPAHRPPLASTPSPAHRLRTTPITSSNVSRSTKIALNRTGIRPGIANPRVPVKQQP